MTARWETFENYLTATAGQAFNSATVAQDLGVSGAEASRLIQAYVQVQRHGGRTQYVIHRTGRTFSAIWHVGARTRDVRELGQQYIDDIAVKITDAVGPDLRSMGVSNPRVQQIAAAVANVIDANLQMLVASMP